MALPIPHSLGADLIWWRTANGMRTAACLYWGGDHAFDQAVHVVACLHDADGREQVRWKVPLPSDLPLIFDSAAPGEWDRFPGVDGVLALHLCTDDPPGPEAFKHQRLFPIVDWRAPDGHLSTLHSDQIISRHVTGPQSFTEIVVLETDTEHNALVILNGDQTQAPGVLCITVANHRGEKRTATHAPSMAPFTVVSVPLVSLFPGVAEFGENLPLLVEGTFASKGLFTRPYVVTTGSRQGAYHGGDLYDWTPVHPARHAIIQGQVNPMAVMLDNQTRTWINILHSHGGHEQDVPIDIRLFDDAGRCVLDVEQACAAARGKLTRIDLATLLPQGTEQFTGHVALSYSLRLKQYVPSHVQALVEYQHRESVAHIMGWSDEWNSRPALARRKKNPPHVNKSFYRVWHDGDFETELVITNAGHRDYREAAHATLTLQGTGGAAAAVPVEIAPYATLRATVSDLFGKDLAILGINGIGALRIESTSDLAAISVTRNRRGTALAMEHFMSLLTRSEGKLRMPAGS